MKTQKWVYSITMILVFVLVVLVAVPVGVTAAEPTINLGSAASFAVLAGSTITNTGTSTIGGSIGGNIGVSPGSSITGFPPGIISDGTKHENDATAIQAQSDLVTAYNDAATRPVTADLTGQDLGGLVLTTGVYSFSSSAQLTGTLILDAQEDPEAVFIFQIASTLTTDSNSVVSLINGARFCRVFWQVGSSATLGTSTEFVGHIFALTSITVNTNATVQGQLLARNGAVTLDSNTITNGDCTVTPTATPAPTATASGTSAGATSTLTSGTYTVKAGDTWWSIANKLGIDYKELAAVNGKSITDTIYVGQVLKLPETVETTADQDVPQTGETNQYLIIGLVLLGLAGGLALVLKRMHSR